MLSRKALAPLLALVTTTISFAAFGQTSVTVRDGNGSSLLDVYAAGDAIGTIHGEIVMGSDGANARAVLVDASGHLLVAGAAAAPSYVRIEDGTTTTLAVVDSNGFLKVSQGTRIAGENISGTRGAIGDWLEIYKAGTYTSTPTKTSTTVNANGTACTAAGGAACTVIYASTEWVAWPNLSITIKNTGANAIDNVIVEWSPDNTSFEAWDTTTFASLASGAIKHLSIAGNSLRYLRVEGRSAAGSSSDVWITANQN